jgi:tRNA (adenine22-N1)-methyltransferase
MDYTRIAAIAEMIKPDKTAADIGTDHAQLALYMLEKGMVPDMIISDLNEGPFLRAHHAAASSLFHDKIDVRKGNGLQVLEKGEAFNVILAGMGGDTIVDILTYDLEKSRSFSHYVLQPMSKPQRVRQFLAAQGWPLLQEKVVRENQRLFIILSTCPGECPYHLSPLEMDIGPLILKDFQQAVVKEYLYSWLKKYRSAAAGLAHAETGRSGALKQQFAEKIRKLEEILLDG